MNLPDHLQNKSCSFRGIRPETEKKYSQAIELYRSTRLSCVDICRTCKVTTLGFQRYLSRYHRDLLLARYDITCTNEEASRIKLGQLRGQLPATHAKYKDAIEACGSLEHIEFNVSQIAREFGLRGTNLIRQLRAHYTGIIEWREKVRERLGLSDNLPRGTRRFSKEQYAKAVKLLRGNPYLTVQEVVDSCGLSYTGLEQHLLFYYKDLVKQRIKIRGKALRQQQKGEITGRGTIHAPLPKTVEKYAEAVLLCRNTPMSIAKIAKKTGVSKKCLYEYLHRWHMDLVCQRRNITYEEGTLADFSKARKYHPSTRAKYAEAIRKLKESELPTAQVAAEYGLQPEVFRSYLKEHEPELYARQGMVKTANSGIVSCRTMKKYEEAIQLYATTTESVKSLARRFGFNDSSFRQFIKRHFPELDEQRRKLVQQMKKTD